MIGILKYQHMYGLSAHESAGYVIARRGLRINHERVPKDLLDKLVKKKQEFKQISNWKQWSAVKKAAWIRSPRRVPKWYPALGKTGTTEIALFHTRSDIGVQNIYP